ncbi:MULTISPECIES: hypothetical protein [unclassified Bradyrhizobium]|uniref:hypothetical protein n=1 Tax=unclassified Bradyrhizobium TaxID=2631580 RepID=UPI000409D78F|nr:MULTISPECIES: hypothetical protein [unclassified Bradyrhizobium]MCP3465791.1 hypothetical protein [Bradyrhizobium sp. CCGUVB23]
MLRRLPDLLKSDTKVLVLQPGGNDARRGESAATADNIAAIGQAAEARGVKVVMLVHLGRLAPSHERLADGQHFSAGGHAAFASQLAPMVSSACGR